MGIALFSMFWKIVANISILLKNRYIGLIKFLIPPISIILLKLYDDREHHLYLLFIIIPRLLKYQYLSTTYAILTAW